ncbi:unnamed protein product [Durusdinium trenchii]|uniref:Uncharacterized protein n=2 Tax=Durusdinium trenchii TaxID=1381693 RepID=A0ABP0RI12_9DINO
MSLAAAAAVAAATSKAEANGERRNSLGQMPKMPWVWVADQRTPSEPRKLPVPKYFQCGNEHIGKLTWDSMKKWLSRGVERQVTSAWIAVEEPGKSEWHLHEVPIQLSSSPFKDGTLVVVCCGNEPLKPNISGQLPAPFKWKPAQTTETSVLGGKMWKSARSRVIATMAFGGPAAFGRRLSGESEKSAATASDADGCASREMSDLRPESASHNKQLLKPAIKKGEGTAKPAGTKPKKVRAKARLKFEEDAVGMELPPESADPAADLNAPAKPWLLYCGPGAPTTMTRSTQTEPLKLLKASRSASGCCQCSQCCCDVYDENDVLPIH